MGNREEFINTQSPTHTIIRMRLIIKLGPFNQLRTVQTVCLSTVSVCGFMKSIRLLQSTTDEQCLINHTHAAETVPFSLPPPTTHQQAGHSNDGQADTSTTRNWTITFERFGPNAIQRHMKIQLEFSDWSSTFFMGLHVYAPRHSLYKYLWKYPQECPQYSGTEQLYCLVNQPNTTSLWPN